MSGRAEAGFDQAAREKALAAIDEAIRAKHEKRTAVALAALDRARRSDPAVPGLDIAFAEIALNEKQIAEMRVAAASALKRGDHAAGASVLLGMERWLSRGASDREMSSAADAASGHFAEATDDDVFLAPAWFFWGDVSRYAGREAEGHDRAVAALHRFNPWDSSDVLAAKIIFASAEAGDSFFGGLEFVGDSPWVRAAVKIATSQKTVRAASALVLTPHAARVAVKALIADPLMTLGEATPPESDPGPAWPITP